MVVARTIYLVLLITLVVTCGAQTISAQQSPAEARQSWENIEVVSALEESVGLPGVPVFFSVEVLSSMYFTAPVIVSTPGPASGIIFELGSSPISRRRGTRTFSGVRFRFLMFPQSAGRVIIPRLSITAKGPPEGSATSRNIQLESAELTIDVAMPPASFPGAKWLAAKNLRVDDRWVGLSDSLATGDALVRIIRTQAEGTAAVLIPDLVSTSIPGVGVYPRSPTTRTDVSGTEVIATRLDSIIYTLEKPGELAIPEEIIYWWDSDLGETKTVRLDPISISALINLTDQIDPFNPDSLVLSGDLSNSKPIPLSKYTGWLLLIAICVAVIVRLLVFWKKQLRLRKEAWAVSSQGRLEAFVEKSREMERSTFVAELYQLLDTLNTDSSQVAQIRSDLLVEEQPIDSDVILALQAELYGGQETVPNKIPRPDTSKLVSTVSRLLTTRFNQPSAHSTKKGEEAVLPPLNP